MRGAIIGRSVNHVVQQVTNRVKVSTSTTMFRYCWGK